MKKNSHSRKLNVDLYYAFDHYGEGYEVTRQIFKKYNVKIPYEDTRNYGVFFYQNKRVKIDPKRYSKMIGLSKDLFQKMSLRHTHFFYPKKIHRLDYNVNVFKDEINDIRNTWIEDYKPVIESQLKKIKPKKYSPGDDYNFMCGISDHEAASMRAVFKSFQTQQNAIYKRREIYLNMLAQFFHYMVARFEAVTLAVMTKNGYKKDRFSRNDFYAFRSNSDLIKNLAHFDQYDKTYCIWNFLKHNSESSYRILKKKYPEVLIDCAFQQGELAIFYVKLSFELIESLIDGVEKFFIEYCALVYNEDDNDSMWNYEDNFSKCVHDFIETHYNPQGLDMFD